MTESQFQGCLLGLALGDALGAPHEGGPLERTLWRMIGQTHEGKARWTDDTQMALDLAESLVANREMFNPDDTARRFASSYRWSRGYGPAAAKLLKRIRRGADWREENRAIYPGGSYGNGGAMRAPVVGLRYVDDDEKLLAVARESARITHAHPSGIEGATLIAVAVAAALKRGTATAILTRAFRVAELDDFESRLELALEWAESDVTPDPREIARRLGNGVAAAKSCVTALYLAARFLDQPLLDMLGFIRKVGGDVDTIGAMSGAVWGARNGAKELPGNALDRLERSDSIRQIASQLFTVYEQNRSEALEP